MSGADANAGDSSRQRLSPRAAKIPVWHANVVPLATFMAEHWLYVPVMGIGLAAGWSVEQLARDGWRRPVTITIAIVVAVYGGLTIRQNLAWRDGRTLYVRPWEREARSDRFEGV